MTVHVLLCTDFEQEMCGKRPTQFASPDGGSDPIVSMGMLIPALWGPFFVQCLCPVPLLCVELSH